MSSFFSTTQKTKSKSEKEPWEPSIPFLKDLLGQIGTSMGADPVGLTDNESFALDDITKRAKTPNPLVDQLGKLSGDLMRGGPDYSRYATQGNDDIHRRLNATADGAYIDPNTNPYISKLLSQVSDDAGERVNAQFAAAGRDMSGMNQQSFARGVTEAQLPVLADLYQQGMGDMRNAASTLYNADNSTAGLLSDLAGARVNRQAVGANMVPMALDAQSKGSQDLLKAEAIRRGIPLETLSDYESLLLPIANVGGTVNTKGKTTNTPSIADMIGTGLKVGSTVVGMF